MYDMDDIESAIADSCGYCSFCEIFISEGGIEPDASEYECPECGNLTLYGIEEAVLRGLL